MPKAWKDIVNSQDYKAWNPEKRARAQNIYFDEVVSEGLSDEDKAQAKAQFFKAYPPPKPPGIVDKAIDVVKDVPRSVKAYGSQTVASLMEGAAGFGEKLSGASDYIADRTGLYDLGEKIGIPRTSGLTKEMVEGSKGLATSTRKMAESIPSTPIERFVGGAAGGALPGITEFVTEKGMPPLAYVMGASEAKKKGESEVLGGLGEAGRIGLLSKAFGATAPLKRGLRMLAQGVVMATGSPEGPTPEAFGTGMLYGMFGGKGEIGLRGMAKKPSVPWEEFGDIPKDPTKPFSKEEIKSINAIKPTEGEGIASKIPPEQPPIKPEGVIEALKPQTEGVDRRAAMRPYLPDFTVEQLQEMKRTNEEGWADKPTTDPYEIRKRDRQRDELDKIIVKAGGRAEKEIEEPPMPEFKKKYQKKEGVTIEQDKSATEAEATTGGRGAGTEVRGEVIQVDKVMSPEEGKALLTSETAKEPVKKATQKDMFGATQGGLEGKIPSTETPETPLEAAQREAQARKVQAEEAKAQQALPTEPLTPKAKATIQDSFDNGLTVSLKNLRESDKRTITKGEIRQIYEVKSRQTTAPEMIEKLKGEGFKIGKSVELYSGIPVDEIVRSVKAFKESIFDPVKAFWSRPPKASEGKNIIGKYLGDAQQYQWRLSRFANAIQKEIPKLDQQAMKRWMQAGGDEATLRQWATQMKDPELKKIYERALNLPEQAKEIARQLEVGYAEGAEEMIKSGILEDTVEFYVNKNWDRPNKASQKLQAWANATSTGKFRPDPKEAKHRIWKSNFEGEQLGYKEKNDSIGFAYVKWMSSMADAKSTREALKSMMSAKMPDGRPMVYVGGGGSYVPKELQAEREAYFIKPNAKPEAAYDYKSFDHPAFRKWKWVDSDPEGKPIMVQGNMLIHPEAYKQINAMIGKSKIRTYTIPEDVPIVGGKQPGRMLLDAGAFVKGTILVGPFHQVHVGEHALFHKVNAFNPPQLDLNKPLTKELLDHGLMLYNHNALIDFGEGVASGGLLEKIPVLGDGLTRYKEYLFLNYISRLKSAMAEEAVSRAEGYYKKDLTSGKLTRDQMLENVAKQANAAFGEQNYKYMGRNPTLQDALRVILLAPDFLEARLRFAGQALRPYGREQQMALLRGAIGMAVGAQVINYMFGDDHKFNWKEPFTILIGGVSYTPRSVMGDVAHLFQDPRSFALHRLNPLTTRTMYEIGLGRDINGRKVNTEEALKDIGKSWFPIPAQGLFRKNLADSKTQSFITGVLNSIGIGSYKHKTEAERKIFEFLPKIDMTAEQKLKHTSLETVRDSYRGGDEDKISETLQNAVEAKTITEKEADRLWNERGASRLSLSFDHINIQQAVEIWKLATPKEKEALYEKLIKKVDNAHKNKSEKLTDELLDEINTLLDKYEEPGQTSEITIPSRSGGNVISEDYPPIEEDNSRAELDIDSIPENAKVTVTELTRKGNELKVTRNAREALAEKKADIKTFQSMLEYLKAGV